MKTILLSFLFLLYSLSVFAMQENDVNVTGGIGLFGTRGILGVSADKFLSQNHAVSLAAGLDSIGATAFVGYKYFGDKLSYMKSIPNSALGKCFFLFECDSYEFIGGGFQYAGKTQMKVTENEIEREYQVNSKLLGLVYVGFRDVFRNNLTLDFELSYRGIFVGGEAAQTAGIPTENNKGIEMGNRTVGFNVGLGYLF